MEELRIPKRLYEIIRENKKEDYNRIIEEEASYPYLYHLSSIRENLIDWLPVKGESSILERNAECGALTGKLIEKASEVTCVTENEESLAVLRARYAQTDGISFYREGQTEWEEQPHRYDMILVAGASSRFRGEFAKLRHLLKKDGVFVLADANRLGLKYFAGCQEEYAGGYFTGIEGYAGADSGAGRCFSRREYIEMLEKAGFCGIEFYYPYPDYKFPSCIYSDRYLPKKGELSDNRRNFDRDRYQLFDERLAFDTLLAEGLFPEFANSFLIMARGQEE